MIKRQFQIIKSHAKAHKTVIQNFGYLSSLQVFNILLPLLAYPYLIRILGAEKYGLIILAQAVTGYFSVFIRFGFDVSATREVAASRDCRQKISQVFTSVMILKSCFLLISLFIFLILLLTISSFEKHLTLYLFSFIICFNDLFFPQYLFLGIEKMKYITVLSVAARLVFLLLILVFVHTPNDYLYVPLLNGIGALCSSIIALYIVFMKEKICLVRVPWLELKRHVKESFPIFLSQSSGAVRSQTNTIFIGSCIGTEAVAYFNIADRLVCIISQLFGNLALAIFPKLSRSKKVDNIYKLLLGTFFIAILCVAVLCIFGKFIIILLCGEKMLPALPVLYILSPLIILQALAHMLNITLATLKQLSAIAKGMLYGTTTYFLLLIILLITKQVTLYTMSANILIAGLCGVIIRFYYLKSEMRVINEKT